MFGRILRFVVCLAVAMNVMFSVPALAFAHEQMSLFDTAQPAVHDHGAVHQHSDTAAASQADDECCAPAVLPGQQPDCHCDMGVCSPVLSATPHGAYASLAIIRNVVVATPQDAGHLSDTLPLLRPPRA